MIFYLLTFTLLCMSRKTYGNLNDSRYPLPILLVLPYPDPRVNSGWDRGLELLPAARVAVREVNNHTDILPGYKLQLIERRSDGCGIPVTSEGILNFVDSVFHRGTNENVLAILGLACSTVTTAVSPIAGREEVSLIQLAIANSDSLRDRDRFPHLWRIISAASVNINAALSLMDSFNWTRVGLIYDGAGVFFRSSADVFRSAITSNEKYTLLLDQSIDEDPTFIESAIDLVKTNGVRIIFVSATVPEAKMLMCEAAKKNVIWPGYVWIFHSRTSEELFDPTCDVDNLNKAIENVTLIDLSLQGRQENETLVSGLTYKEYLEAYDSELENVRSKFESYLTHFNFTNNLFANPMYDEVWALALALNASLPELKNRGLHFEKYCHNKAEITEIVEERLREIQFEGAVAKVSFNNLQEVVSPVVIYQVRNGKSMMIGKYNEATNNLTLLGVSREHVPSDEYATNYNLIDQKVAIVFLIFSGLGMLFTTILVVLMFKLKNTPEILAISPYLSLLIYIGCYFLLLNVLVLFFTHSYLLERDVFNALCILERWLAHCGFGLIFSTILVKLIRVYLIFTKIKVFGKILSNRYLLLYSLTLCTPQLTILIIGMAVNPLSYQKHSEIRNDVNPPTIVITPVCIIKQGLEQFFEITIITYTFLIALCSVMFALRTRKVNYRNFKDTKKIVALSYIFVILFPLVHGTWFILSSSNMRLVYTRVLMLGIVNLTVPVAIQCFLFVPKIIPGAYFTVLKKRSSI